MAEHDPATCTWWADPGPLWLPQPCPIEGCRYEQTENDGCGLARLRTVEESMKAWDDGDPIEHGCLASRRGEDAAEHWECPMEEKAHA